MSYILDALKKLENEKQKKTRGDGMLNISGALFKDEPRRTSGGHAWKIAALVVVASLVTFGATWFLLKPGKSDHNVKPRPIAPAAAIKRVPPPPSPVSPVQQPPVVPSQAVSAAPAIPVAKVVIAQGNGRRPKERKGNAVPSVPEEQPAVQTSAAPADIKVSGIAWQDERSARRAVVNGFLVREGGVVSGARITEILKDRLRFSLAGRVFEVPLTISGLSGAEK